MTRLASTEREREAFDYEALLVKDTGRAPMDYLACVDELIDFTKGA